MVRTAPQATTSKSRTTSEHADSARSRPATKQALIVGLLKRRKGATLADLAAATGWQPHSVRAALTGLRKREVPIERTTDKPGHSVYRVATGAS